MASRSKLQVLLLVDDDEALRECLEMLLTSSEYEVSTAESGRAALLKMNDSLPDLVISDLNMPQMSGYELLSEIRQRFPKVLRVAMSGAHKGPSVPPGVAANAFFGKGGNVLNLLEIVADLTGNSATCLSAASRAA